VKVTLDTNVLVRAVVQDDPEQARVASHLMLEARLLAVPLPCLCELVWVLLRVYRLTTADVCEALEALLAMPNVEMQRPAVQAGLLVLRAGGDFADGVIAHEGRALGGETLVTFDMKAVRLLQQSGVPARLLEPSDGAH
jgi:predicted nucleic-acid-binding protein